VDKTERHNTRENQIKQAFKALKYPTLAIYRAIIIFALLTFVAAITSYSFYSKSVASDDIKEKTFGVVETTNIFPTNVSASHWNNLDEALSQDLPDYALFQDFDSDNAAFLGEDNDGGHLIEISAEGENVDTEASESDTETAGAADAASESEPEAEEQAEIEPLSYFDSSHTVYTQAHAFPLAQLSITSSTQATDPHTHEEAHSSEDVEIVESVSEVDVVETETVATTTERSVSQPEELPPQEQLVNDIKLTNFKTASLEEGQFVDSLQLRLSLAAQASPAEDGSLPYIDILFKGGVTDSFRSVGSIIIDDEVSNAINGGYYLFALPGVTDPEELSDVEVMLRVNGPSEQVSSIQLDAVWLELNARSVTIEDLEERTEIEQLTHLEPPKITTLVSEEINFALDEVPVFNLRYESQQNFIVRGFMHLLGRDGLDVKAISVNHESVGHIEIEPEVTIAGDGLVTIELPGNELDVMRPGLYEINMLFEENGFEYVETFDFQWGMMTINPNKTSYKVGESASLFMGALSPGGSTLCEENLALYITSPSQVVTKVPVEQSGKCNGNNVIDVPDYSSVYETSEPGEYQLYLERLDESGGVLGFTTDTFLVEEELPYSIERNGPTRIFPPAPYPMSLTVTARDGFNGSLVERVPASFMVGSTTATITMDGDWQLLSWDLELAAGEQITVSYGFDAPDISPYIYRLGEASLEKTSVAVSSLPSAETSTSSEVTASSTETVSVDADQAAEVQIVFAEHRQWQIASDATGSMILMWDGPVVPSGWTCISCTGGDVFYQRFIMGSSTVGVTGGSATHTHTASGAVALDAGSGDSNTGGGGTDVALLTHTHTYTPSITATTTLPRYRNLVIIQHNSAGEPTSIPAGAIAVFDAAVPTGWTQYAAQNGFYVRGESIANRTVTGGSNTHTHPIGGTTGAASGGTNANGAGTNIATQNHTHTVTSNTGSQDHQPPYIEVILGKLNSTSTMPNDSIVMWSDTQPSDWNAVSTSSTPLANRIFKPAATYGATGGATNHTPADVTGIVTSAPSASVNRTTTGSSDSISTHTHTVNVTGFSNATHLPPYRTIIFAKRAGGAPPLAPTIHELFDNEKTGTSTPHFEFTADDSVGTDTLVYQFQWDDDSDLETSPLGDRTSDVETGCSPNCFENTVNGGDSSPFTEAERIRFSIQSALTNDTTYYYRVRAKKTTGSTWGSWSEIYSFTYVDETNPSQWLQTQDAQFSKGTLSDAEVYGSNSVRILQNTPDEALVAYGEGSITTPRYRVWDGTAWSATELSALDVGGVIEWVKVEPGVTRDEYILGTQDANSDVNVQVYDGVSDTWGGLQEVTLTISDVTRRGFDIAYESQSGDAMVAYCNGSSVDFRFWNGSTWSSASTTATVSANNCNYVALASDPISDEIILVTRDTAAAAPAYEAKVWNGSAWTLNTTLGNMSNTNNEGIAVEYEESGGQAMVTVSNGAGNNFAWSAWDGTEWSTPLTHAIPNDYQWGTLKRDVGTDNMVLCYVDTDNDLGIVRWDGDMWQTAQEYETGGFVDTGRGTSCEFETTSGRDGYIIIAYSDTTNSRWRDWNGSILNGTEGSISTITEAWEIGTTRTGDGKVLGYFHDSVNTNYDFSWWNGTTWSVVQTLETSASVTANPRKQPIGIAAQVFVPSEGTITTDEINFSLVPNRPTWGEVSWSTTEPSGTDVKIQLLYATSSGCNTLIPNGTLSGNAAGFDATASPLDLTSLSTTTYSKICLRATLTSGNASTPTLDDWTVSWERQSFLVQSQYRWYVNANSENPSDAWPSGAFNLSQNETIPVDYSPGSGDILRLRMALRSDNAALAVSEKAFKLQYAQSGGVCASSTAWFDVGEVGSTTALWRGHNNLLAFDGSTLSTLLLGTDVGGTYEEENDSDVNPNQILVGNEAEWDWAIEHNGAEDGTQYCFRMVNDEGTTLSDYEQYPSLTTNDSPQGPTLEKRFDNEQVASTSPWFEFVALDTENDDISYQIQIDDTYDFSSTVLDRNSVTNFSEFENIVTPADKDPFTVGQTVRFKPSSALTNGTTYYWRVRGKDGSGSNDWGDWSTVYSVTIDTGTSITTWLQTTEEQFSTDSNDGTEVTAFDDVVLSSGFLNGTTTTSAIDFDDKSTGNAWGSLSWSHNVTSGSIRYRIEYFDGESWVLVPDSFLPGNNSGFTSGPVTLLGLDPQVHNEIRVRANLSDSGGSPRLLSLKVEWGYAVEQPTQLALFDNEKTGTTTPTFRFTTTDPDNDDIQYEFSWSTDSTFTTGVNVATSGVSAGFANETVGVDTSPFFSGDTISYKIQSALSNGTTYWWRVRGKDPFDGDAWSVWSPTRSFTVDTSVTVSTWFQTTDAQFNTDTLEDTETTGGGAVEVTSTIREAFTAYAEGTVQTPRYRIWNGASWGTEKTGTSVGGSIRFVESAAAPTRDEYVIATQDSTGRVRAQIYNGSTETTGNLQTIITAVPGTSYRGFDVAYESTSGDLMVVACDTTEATYYIWNGSTWSGPNAITLGTAGNCNWIQLGADPTTDEIILVARDTIAGATDYQAQVWNGSAWANPSAFGSGSEANNEGIAIEYEESGDRAVVVVPNGTGNSYTWNSWTGAGWVGAATVALTNDFENGRMARDLGSDNIILCGIDNDGRVMYVRWNGTTNAWLTPQTLVDGAGNSKVGRPFGCQYETTAGRDGYIMMPYSDTTNAQYRVFDGSTFPAENAISTILDAFEVRTVRTGDGNILAMFYDDDTNTQYDFSYWNGTVWSTVETLEATAITTTAPATVPLDIVARRYPAFTSGTVYSPAIDFDDGSGLKWQEARFTDTTPGASNILYQVEYYDGDSWGLIPNTALSGNSSGFTTSPIDLSQVSRITYNTIRLKASLSCSGSDCPTLSDWTVTWSAGINVAGTLKQYNQTASTTAGTVAVAVNGVLQAGKTAAISNGAWSIPNVTAFGGDIVTVFVTGAANTAEAVGVARYDGDGDITGMTMFERHLSLGSNDATTTALTNSDIGAYDFTNTEDAFFSVTGTALAICADTGCFDAELYVKSGTYYTPGGKILTHDFENNGTFTAGAYTHEINGSWDNNATTTMTGSTVVFAATSTTEFIDSTGALSGSFNNVTMGTTTGNGTWTLPSTLDVNGNLTISRGTLARGTAAITLAGNFDIATNGFITGVGTTTFDGGTAATWRNQNPTLQNSGNVVVDGTSKAITLTGNVAAQSITIGANDTLDASAGSYDITVYANWINQNNFVARSGEVFFAATSTGKIITTTGDAFFDLTFSGSGGGWSFTETTALINNDVRVSAGTVTLPSATTTVAGSFLTTSGTFQHNNGTLYFTSATAESITFAGTAFTNVAGNMWFQGAGNWTVTDTNATSTGNVVVQQGTLNFPGGVMAIGGRLRDIGGVYTGGAGTVRFYSATAQVLTAGGSSFNNVTFDGAGSWSFTDASVTVSRNLTIQQGTLTLPSTAMLIAGSYENNATVVPGTGTVQFNSTDAGETIDFGGSSLYNVTFSSAGGGWTLVSNGTTTNNFTITSATNLTVNSGTTLSVGGTFTNSVGGAATTWAGSTLALRAGNYSLNTKANTGDTYGTIAVSSGAKIAMWNSSATSYTVPSSGSLYSQDHNAVDGDLYIFGGYTRTTGTEYWSYATDFDGTALGGSPRQVDVRFAASASAAFTGATLNVTGISTASTTVANQGSGTYVVTVTGGTTTAQYYEFSNLGATGVSLLGGVSVSQLGNGTFVPGVAAGVGLTISSTTIDANPSKQILGVRFATTSAISAYNVAQTDGSPASFWWFRDGTGNLYGEAFDNDTGNPGSIRFNDSSLVFDIQGTVYADGGVTPIVGGTCDGSAAVVRAVVNGGASYTSSCSNLDGSYHITGVTVTGDPTITIYLDGASGGEKGSVITRTPTADITDADIYANRVIVRNEDVDPLTIANLAVYDVDNDADIRFAANAGALTVQAGTELFVWNGSTFTPGGVVTLYGNAGANSYDGTLYIDDNATFNAYASTTVTLGGRFVADAGAIFSAASSTVLMNATTSGKSITAAQTVTFNNLTFNGSGGTWNITPDIVVGGNMSISSGTVTGTGDISLPYGSITGNGVLSLGAGTTTLARSNTLGGTSAWTFFNLELGNGSVVGTTTPVSAATTTISGRLTIAAAHFLDAGSTYWDLAGTGTVFVENGTFLEDTSTVRYSGSGANVRSTPYYNLDINAGAGSPTYTAVGLGIIVGNNLTVGGVANTTFNVSSSDPALDVNGNVTIRNNGTFIASNSASFTVAQNFTNDGTFTGGGGGVTFDGAGAAAVAAGSSSFSDVLINKTGAITFTEHATSTGTFRLQAASSFTVQSGQQLAVGGTFFNALGGGATTWTGSTLHLYNGGNYSINAATTTDSYASLSVDGATQIRMWNSDAGTYLVDSTASLYSQDHANVAGDLYIFGAYRKTTGADYWSYATDFDGSALGGSSRKVDVFMASGASASFTGGSLQVLGASTASTTIQNQGSGTYSMLIGGNASTSLQYYEVTDINSSGLVLTSTPTINNLSNGTLEVSQNGGTAITVGGTVISANPAKNFNRNIFRLDGVGSGFNVTATGTASSAWRFANHAGDIDGEGFDVDPNGDPGYVSWDDSAALITVSGTVYSNESGSISTVCDGSTNNILLRVAGITTYSTYCDGTTGEYVINNVSYGSADTLVVYIDGETEKGAAVTQDPITDVTNFSVYENRVVVRHEGTAPLTIDDMAVWDSSDDADIPFTAVSGSPDVLTLPANRKLIVASGKTFQPGGNVTLSGSGGGAAYDGTLELYSNANWVATGAEALSVGGSMILGAGADYTPGTGTTTFTTTGATRTIDLNTQALHNVAFTGSGSWTITDATFTANGNVLLTGGTLDLPTGTSTFTGSFVNNGGAFDANSGVALFSGGTSHTLRMGGSSLATTIFTGGNYNMLDTNATSTGSVTIESGTITLPSGYYAVGGDFANEGGSITHNTSELVFRNATAATLIASSSDLYAVRFAGGGAYSMLDEDITLQGSLFVSSGSLTLASGTIAIGGSFDAAGGTFEHSSSTILFNSSDTGEVINPGVSDFYAVQIGAPTGGYTLTASATTTHNFTIASAAAFAVQSGVTLRVEGVFTNSVGGTNTNWNASTLVLSGANAYSINSKTTGADQYSTLVVGIDSDIRMWNSAATTTTVQAGASLYSQDHSTVNGYVYIYGDFHISSSTEYWSYGTDFDGTNLFGSERVVQVRHAANATTTIDGGALNIVGTSGNETVITNQGSGTYGFSVTDGTFNAQRYDFRNLNVSGLTFSGSPTISSLAYGDFMLAVNGGSLMTVASSTINANASFVIPGAIFATSSPITGTNVTLVGATANAWTFTSHSGNLDGESYDDDGLDECGSIRWSDSECLITQQTHYRWRNDNGGAGVQASEWFNTNWDARKSVRVDNADATTYSDAVVQLFVDYDSDMQADFDDLRFTGDDGVTPIPYWVGSTTDSDIAEVWVKVPSLPSDGTANIFMYYNNPTASSSESIDDTFLAADDFEDGDIAEYSGQTTLFGANTSFLFDGDYGLDNAGDEGSRANTGGMYRLDQVVSQGETFRFMQYVDTSAGSGDETCVKFGVQNPGSANDNYAVCLEQFGTDRISLAKDVIDNDSSGIILATSTVTYTTGWYEVEVDWETDDDIIASLFEADGTLVTTISDTDSSYTSGGIGFTYWFHYGGWDSVSSRPILTTEPSIRFGAEQTDGGATWKAAIDSAASYDAADIARLRIAIENSGLAITGQQLLLEYAALGTAPSCEAVASGDYTAVPPQASCGTSPVCMQSSTYITNGASIADLLLGTEGAYTLGQVREDPSNVTSGINIDQDYYTEVEYAITPTTNVIDENLCFRVTNNGTPFDTYLKVAQLSFRFDPTVTNVVLNEGLDIDLLPGTTTAVYVTATTTDLNGAADLAYATATVYRIGAVGGAACTPNNNDCYVSSCSFTNCADTTCDIECRADIYFHADPTDDGAYMGEEWLAFVEVEDVDFGYAFDNSIGVGLNSLRAIDVPSVITYGSVEATFDTGGTNASTSVENLGNTEINVEVEGTDMTDGTGSIIPSYEQKFATSTFTYSACTSCYTLSSTTPFELDIELQKPTTDTPILTDEVYWGVEVPFGTKSTPHSGMNVFTPVSP
jgi:Domain of unknown function (DUF2341)